MLPLLKNFAYPSLHLPLYQLLNFVPALNTWPYLTLLCPLVPVLLLKALALLTLLNLWFTLSTLSLGQPWFLCMCMVTSSLAL